MEKYLFTKLSGAGNDFVLFDSRINSGLKLNPLKIRKICDRKYGVGGDGILLISDNPGVAFDVQYYNADGSGGSLCGNGARCAIYYCKISGRFGNELVNFTLNGTGYSGSVLEDRLVRFNLNPPGSLKYNIKFNTRNFKLNSSFIDTGSPHVVININDVLDNNSKPAFRSIDDIPLFEIGREIRYSPEFAPGGTNVNIIEIRNDVVYIRTYERGVENETLACGSGSVAAALLSNSAFGLESPVRLSTKGGSELLVHFKRGGGNFEEVSLTGPAEVIFSGELSI